MYRKTVSRLPAAAFICSALFLCWALARLVGWDGVFIQGISADLGEVNVGKRLVHTLRITNLTPASVIIVQQPTCGCESPDRKTVIVGPFRSGTLDIAYNLSPQETGRRLRTVVLYVKQGNDVQKREGRVVFIRKKPPLSASALSVNGRLKGG